jgi:hypothetical protein
MAKLGSYQPREKVEVPDNLYFAQIKKIELKKWSEENITFNWTFEICQPPFLGKRVWVWGTTGTVPTPKARLTAWMSVLGYGREQLVSDEFDTDKLVGAYVKILLKTWEKESGGTKQGVTDLLPMTDVDTQVLQSFLAQLPPAGPIKVAVQASAPVVHVSPAAIVAPVIAPVLTTSNINAPGVNPAPTPMQPVVAPVAPVVAAPAPVAPKRTSSFPF